MDANDLVKISAQPLARGSRPHRGLQPLDAQARHDLLEILEDRYGRKSTIVTSQLDVASWHHAIADATYADAILDRLVHNAHRVELDGDSLRRTRGRSTLDDTTNN